jgi:hypothetical protein
MHVFERHEEGFFGGVKMGSARGCILIVCIRLGKEGSGGCWERHLADSWAGTKPGVGSGRARDCMDIPTRLRDAPAVRKRLEALLAMEGSKFSGRSRRRPRTACLPFHVSRGAVPISGRPK